MAYSKKWGIFKFVDLQSQKASLHLAVDVGASNADITSLGAALYACSDAGNPENGNYAAEFQSAPPQVGAYGNIEDKALLIFRASSTGETIRISIPAPQVIIFTADGETVDKAQEDVAALIALIKSKVRSKSGATITDFIKGYRQRSKMRKAIPGVV